MILAASACIQYGILPDLDRLVIPMVRQRSVQKPMNGSECQQLEAVRTRRVIIRLARLGYPDRVIAAFVDRSPHHVYDVRKRSGIKRYRTDSYVRPRRVKKIEQPETLRRAA